MWSQGETNQILFLCSPRILFFGAVANRKTTRAEDVVREKWEHYSIRERKATKIDPRYPVCCYIKYYILYSSVGSLFLAAVCTLASYHVSIASQSILPQLPPREYLALSPSNSLRYGNYNSYICSHNWFLLTKHPWNYMLQPRARVQSSRGNLGPGSGTFKGATTPIVLVLKVSNYLGQSRVIGQPSSSPST